MQNNSGKILVGVLLIAVGLMSIAGNFLHLPFHFSHYLFSFPAIMMIAGLIVLLNHRNSLAGVLLVVIGGFWFLSRYSDFPVRFWLSEYWPIILILLGAYIILKREGSNQMTSESEINSDDGLNIDYIDDASILGGGRKAINSQNFKGGKISIILGGSDIDLHNSSLAEGTHYLDLTVMFGGIDIIVPRDWKIIVNVTSIFGGFDDKRVIDFNQIQESNKVLIIRGFVLFGGGDLKTF